MVRHAIAGLPNEACGLLGGRFGTDHVEAFVATRNADESAKTYSIGPDGFLAADRDLGPLGLDVVGGNDVTIGEMPEIQFHPRLETPFKGNLVNGDRGSTSGDESTVHRRMVVVGRIEMGTVVRRQHHPLDRPAFAIGQIVGGHARKECGHLGRGLAVAEILDFRDHARRVRGDAGFERDGEVDDPHAGSFRGGWGVGDGAAIARIPAARKRTASAMISSTLSSPSVPPDRSWTRPVGAIRAMPMLIA